MQQNQNFGFIELTGTNGNKLKLQPSFIVMMERWETESIPTTALSLTTNGVIQVLETPEQIADLQDQLMESIGRKIGELTQKMIVEFNDKEWGY
jgi:hypothetical protein